MASFSGSYEINTVIAHTAPAVLELLQGGVARSKNDIIAALAGRYSKNDITHTLMRLSVTGRLIETGRKYGLPDSTNLRRTQARSEPDGQDVPVPAE